jgi:outer membrane lipoprotein-sorting protein
MLPVNQYVDEGDERMRRASWVLSIVLSFAVVLSGCGLVGKKDSAAVVKDLDKVMNKLDSYHATGKMQLQTGLEPQEYAVEVCYQAPHYYRISLTNEKKDITQIVLRNDDGVFVLTPHLNKSFRFQSDWPENQGQVYLYQSLVQSIMMDNDRQFTSDKEAYVFDVLANYQNGSLARQKIWLGKKDYAPHHVEVSDANANVMVIVDFNNFEFGKKFEKDSFDMQRNMTSYNLQTQPTMAAGHNNAATGSVDAKSSAAGQQGAAQPSAATSAKAGSAPAASGSDKAAAGSSSASGGASAGTAANGGAAGAAAGSGTGAASAAGAAGSAATNGSAAGKAAATQPSAAGAAAPQAGATPGAGAQGPAATQPGAATGASGAAKQGTTPAPASGATSGTAPAAPTSAQPQAQAGSQSKTVAAAKNSLGVIVPEYMPAGVKQQDIRDMKLGEDQAVLIRFSGKYNYSIIESMPQAQTVTSLPGDIMDLGYTLGVVTGEDRKTLTWTYEGVEFRLSTADLPPHEMVKIAQAVQGQIGK